MHYKLKSPKIKPWQAAYLKRIISLVGWAVIETINYGLLYDQDSASSKVVEYVDSDYTRNLNNKRSMIDYAFKFVRGLIS